LGVYDLYRKRMSSSLSDSEVADCEISTDIKSNFTQQPNYRQVYRNDDLATAYDILFANGNVKDKTVGYKQLISYPYDTYVFQKGDYIHMAYGGESTTWLLTTLEATALYDVKGRLEQCNNDMKWIDSNGVLQSYRCVIQDEIKEDRIRDNRYITIPDGYIRVYVQSNSDTSQLKTNQRFIFNGSAYQIRSVINYADTGLIRYIMVKDAENEETDDLINNIADVYSKTYSISIVQDNFEQEVGYTNILDYNLTLNDEVSTADVEWVSSDLNIATINSSTGQINLLALGSVTFTARMSENADISDAITVTVVGSLSSLEDNLISPDISSIYQGETQTYTAYNYVDNVASADTFTIVGSGASTDNYTLTIIDGNSFSVKSLGYDATALTITCTNDTDASTVVKQIGLKGLW